MFRWPLVTATISIHVSKVLQALGLGKLLAGAMRTCLALASLALTGAEENVSVPYAAPDVQGLHFAETFDGDVPCQVVMAAMA